MAWVYQYLQRWVLFLKDLECIIGYLVCLLQSNVTMKCLLQTLQELNTQAAGEGEGGNVRYSESFSWIDSKAAWSAVLTLHYLLCVFPCSDRTFLSDRREKCGYYTADKRKKKSKQTQTIKVWGDKCSFCWHQLISYDSEWGVNYRGQHWKIVQSSTAVMLTLALAFESFSLQSHWKDVEYWKPEVNFSKLGCYTSMKLRQEWMAWNFTMGKKTLFLYANSSQSTVYDNPCPASCLKRQTLSLLLCVK